MCMLNKERGQRKRWEIRRKERGREDYDMKRKVKEMKKGKIWKRMLIGGQYIVSGRGKE